MVITGSTSGSDLRSKLYVRLTLRRICSLVHLVIYWSSNKYQRYTGRGVSLCVMSSRQCRSVFTRRTMKMLKFYFFFIRSLYTAYFFTVIIPRQNNKVSNEEPSLTFCSLFLHLHFCSFVLGIFDFCTLHHCKLLPYFLVFSTPIFSTFTLFVLLHFNLSHFLSTLPAFY